MNIDINLQDFFDKDNWKKIEKEAREAKLPVPIFIFGEYNKLLNKMREFKKRKALQEVSDDPTAKPDIRDMRHSDKVEVVRHRKAKREGEGHFSDAWGLSTRAHNLVSANFENPEDLASCDLPDLLEIDGMGAKTASEIIDAMGTHL